MSDSAHQPSGMPTRKLTTVVVGAPVIYAMLGDAVREVWPQVVPAFLAGDAMVSFAAVAIPTVLAGVVAYFIPDRPNVAN